MPRRGMGKGRGKGYKNIVGKDPKVHAQSARGRKQPERISPIIISASRASEIALETKTILNLDPIEKMMFNKVHHKHRSIEQTLRVLFNTVNGDETQLSPALHEYARKKGWIGRQLTDTEEYWMLERELGEEF